MSHQAQFQSAIAQMHQVVLGQSALIDSLMIGLLIEGHVLLEGPPGLAKTTAAKALSDSVEGDFQRIQFTPDLLPGDLTGTEIYSAKNERFDYVPGPLFHNFILADEINRAPAKVQAALLEAMAEHQITVAGKRYDLPEPFMVLATQNPLEQEGTYALPEAQLDRFALHVQLDYPSAETELAVMRRVRERDFQKVEQAVSKEALLAARDEVKAIFLSEDLERYLVALVCATRTGHRYIEQGVSPRATLTLDKAVRAHAWLNDRAHVEPIDIQTMLFPVLRHRLLLSYQAMADRVTADDVIQDILNSVVL